MTKSALRDCKACGKEVSRHSPFCRQCGHPQGYPLVIWLLMVFLLMMIAFYLTFTVFGLCNVEDLRVSGDSWSVEPSSALVVEREADNGEAAEEEAADR
jgi:hypothetical protein